MRESTEKDLIFWIIAFLCVMFLCSCLNKHTIEDAKIIAENHNIKSEIVWTSERGNPYADGEKIYISLEWVNKYNLNDVLHCLLLHEEYHNRGLKHCKDENCLMYEEYKVDLVFGAKEKTLCNECEGKLK